MNQTIIETDCQEGRVRSALKLYFYIFIGRLNIAIIKSEGLRLRLGYIEIHIYHKCYLKGTKQYWQLIILALFFYSTTEITRFMFLNIL